jgi:TrmH family RNA methyltransferase
VTSGPALVTSAANPLLKDLRKLSQDSHAYRKLGRVWLEGEHLCDAALKRGVKPQVLVIAESFAHREPKWLGQAAKDVLVEDALFATLSSLESPARMGFVIDAPPSGEVAAKAPSVVLDRLQDAGNVGSILRSAAAFGFTQVVALKGTAALWSPKVLRAGMGAHFALSLVESVDASQLAALQVPLIATSSHGGEFLHGAKLPWPCAWLLGHEGQGLDADLASRANISVRIAQPGGEESLNVAAAAAICLHQSAVTPKG